MRVKVDRLLRSWSPKSSQRESGDFVGEAYIALIEAVDSYRPELNVPLWNWVKSKVKYRILTVLRTDRKDRSILVGLPDTEQRFGTLYRKISAEIEALPVPARTVMAMYLLDGYTEREIGAALQMKRHQVNYVKQKSLSVLQTRLGDVYGSRNESGT